MGKVDAERFGSTRPKITQEDLADGDFVIATVTGYEETEVPDKDHPDGKRPSAMLSFEEFGDKVLWLNKSQLTSLVERLGDDSDAWTGARVPLVKTTRNFGKDTHHKVEVAEAEEWDELLEEAGESAARASTPRRSAAPAPAPATAKGRTKSTAATPARRGGRR